MRLLRDRGDDLAAAGVRAFGVSMDSHWSHRAWAEALGVSSIPLLSDRLGEAATAFGVLGDADGMPRAERSAFLVADDTVRTSWLLGRELPDVDAIVAAASSSSP
ncbi:MAG: redoxin domain-containing protein [Thermoleophilia bacterium]|nr:redoxin domain-containing protein [Thermoleophilia bacterium]MDH4346282.1 redoxin domain-containing protein [Thermoleophilia bacterium]MDH5334311.1 redoxin domain-containing protein [Thermoleophilia bacterium]